MPGIDTAAMMSIVEKLKVLLERETTLRGEELDQLVLEKERLVSELEISLRLNEPGAAERAAELQSSIAPLTFANGFTLKFNRIRLQLSRLRNPEAEAVPTKRLDLIS